MLIKIKTKKYILFVVFLFSSFECSKNEIARKLEDTTIIPTNNVSEETEFTEKQTDSVSGQTTIISISSDQVIVIDKSTSVEEREIDLSTAPSVIEEGSTSIEEMSEPISSASIEEGSTSIEESSESIKEGSTSIGESSESISSVYIEEGSTSIEESSESIKEGSTSIGESSESISSIYIEEGSTSIEEGITLPNTDSTLEEINTSIEERKTDLPNTIFGNIKPKILLIGFGNFKKITYITFDVFFKRNNYVTLPKFMKFHANLIYQRRLRFLEQKEVNCTKDLDEENDIQYSCIINDVDQNRIIKSITSNNDYEFYNGTHIINNEFDLIQSSFANSTSNSIEKQTTDDLSNVNALNNATILSQNSSIFIISGISEQPINDKEITFSFDENNNGYLKNVTCEVNSLDYLKYEFICNPKQKIRINLQGSMGKTSSGQNIIIIFSEDKNGNIKVYINIDNLEQDDIFINNNKKKNSSSGFPKVVVIAIIIVLALIIVITIIACYIKKRKVKSESKPSESAYGEKIENTANTVNKEEAGEPTRG